MGGITTLEVSIIFIWLVFEFEVDYPRQLVRIIPAGTNHGIHGSQWVCKKVDNTLNTVLWAS